MFFGAVQCPHPTTIEAVYILLLYDFKCIVLFCGSLKAATPTACNGKTKVVTTDFLVVTFWKINVVGQGHCTLP